MTQQTPACAQLLFLRELLLAFSVLLRHPSILSCLLSSKSLGTIVLRHGLDNRLLFLGVDDGDGIGEGLLGTGLAFWVAATHDLDLNTQNTLSEEDVAGSSVDEVVDGLAGVDHEAVSELHALCSSSTQLARNNHLATLGTALHDESQHTVACSSHGQTVQQLVSERFALGDGRETAVLDLGGIEGNAVLGELESLLDERGEFADSSTLFAQDFLGVCRPDDDVGDCRRDSNFNAGVALLGQLALEELVQLGIENTVGNELASLGDRSLLSRHDRGLC